MNHRLQPILTAIAFALAIALFASLVFPRAVAADPTRPGTAKDQISDTMWRDLYLSELTSKIAVHAGLLKALDRGATNTIRFILLSSLTNSITGIEGMENVQLTGLQVKAISIGKDALSTYGTKPTENQ